MKLAALIFITQLLLCSIVPAQNQLWTFQIEQGIYSSPVISNSTLYFGGNDSSFYALDKSNGKLIWSFKAKGRISSTATFHQDQVIIHSSDGQIHALNKMTGKPSWKFMTKGDKIFDLWDYYISSPVMAENAVFVGSGDSCVYALDAVTGKQLWKFRTGNVVHATPIISHGMVLVGSFDGYFYALDQQSGELKWKFNTVGDAYFPRGEVQKAAMVYENSVIFGSRDYNIYALNIEQGTGLWNMKERGSWIIAKPYELEGNLFFGTSDSHRFYCMNAKSGEVIWTLPVNMRVYGAATSYQDRIYFGCFNGKIYGVNKNTSEIEFEFQNEANLPNYNKIYDENGEFQEGFQLYGNNMLASEKAILEMGAILSSPLIENGVIYFGDANGVFYAVKISN